MRILHIGKYYAPQRGGIERYTQDLAEWLVGEGVTVAALVHNKPGGMSNARETIGGVDVTRAACFVEIVYTPISPTFPATLANALADFRPDVLHLHLPNPSAFAVLASPLARKSPWIVHWHADVPPDSPDWRLRLAYRVYKGFERRVLERASAIVATSQPYLDASRALASFRAKAQVIPLGVGEAPATSAPSPAWPNARGLKLLAVGRFSTYKGFDVLLDALSATPDAQLLLVGAGERERDLRAQSARLGLDDRVRFAGALDDATLAASYEAADAFVLPSIDRGEAFGLVLLEAMRAGLPVIATAIPGSGVGDVVADGATGLQVAPNDSAALARAIATFAGDEALRRRLGDAGRERWRERFTLASSARAVLALYRHVLGAAPAERSQTPRTPEPPAK